MILPTNYLTSTDARITILEHPGKVRGVRNRTSWSGYEIDVAHFQLSAGRAPVHIWNYARRGGGATQASAAGIIGEAGGAMFDDTAVANEMCQLQLVINRERFLESAVLFAPQTQIGTLQIRYADTEGQRSGYTLFEGHVGQAAEEISTANGLFMTVTLLFQRAVPLSHINPRTREELAVLPGQDAVTLLPFHAEYRVPKEDEEDTIERQYHPVLARKDRDEHVGGGAITVKTNVQAGIRQTIPGTFDTIRDMEYIGAFVEAHNDTERQLFIWNPCTQEYMAIQRTSVDKQPIINDGLLTELAARLLGRAVLGRNAITSLEGYVLQSSDNITLLQEESSIGC